MTTATLTLFKVQTRHLVWPFLMLLAAGLACAIPPLQDDSNLAFLLVILSVWVSGPLLFGAEYSEGARDFLATRPVSPRTVFWTKAIPLCCIALAGSLLLDSAVTPNRIIGLTENNFSRATPLLAAVFLDLALWGALCTVIFRETIRGFLYCGASFIVAAIVVAVSREFLFRTEIELLGHDMPWMEQHTQGVIFGAALLTLTPLPLFGILEAVHRSRLRHRFAPTVSLGITVSLFLTFLVLTSYWLRTDGHTSILDVRKVNWPYQVAAMGMDDNTLQFVTTQDGLSLHTMSLHAMNIDNPFLGQPASIVIDTTPSSGEKLSYTRGRVFQDRIVLVRHSGGVSARTWVDLYKASESGQSAPMQSICSMGPFHQTERGTLAVLTKPEQRGPMLWIECDLETGEMLDNPESEARSKELSTLNYRCATTGQRRYRDSWRGMRGIFIENRSNPLDAEPLGRIARLAPAAVNDNLVAGFSVEDPTRELFRTRAFDEIHLYDTTDPSNPILQRIRLPFRFNRGFIETGRFLELLGLKTNSTSSRFDSLDTEAFLTLGGDYLFVWWPSLHRVAVWDVGKPTHADFIGIAEIPTLHRINLQTERVRTSRGQIQPPVHPIQRSDGALGFLHYDYGIVWLEFPELMKEKDA